MRRALAVVLLSSCFNLDNDFQSYCARTGRCDAGVSAGGGSANGGGLAQGGGLATGGGLSTGGGTGGSAGGAAGGAAGGTGGACSDPSMCTSPANATPVCTSNLCNYMCNPTFHACSATATCAMDTDVNQCGPSCMVCPGATGVGTRSCDAGACDINCPASYHRCATSCAINTSVNQCGASCETCTPPTGANAFCDAGVACDFACGAGYVRMGNICIAPPTLTFPNIGDITDPNTFIDARLDPFAPTSTLWALDFGGQVLVSSNLGLSFTPVCRLPNTGLDPTWSGFAQRAYTRVIVSPAADRTAYVTTGQYYSPKIYRAALDGGAGNCADVSIPPGPYSAVSAVGSGLTIGSDGVLWEFDGDGTGGRVRRSFDRGTTWQTDAGLLIPNSGNAYGFLNIEQNAEQNLLLSVVAASGGTAVGLYVVYDGGTQATKVSAGIYGTDMMPRWSAAQPGYAYANRGQATTDGFLSSNGGVNWTQSPPHSAIGDWSVDPVTGAGYRFSAYDGGENLERAADMRAPVWLRTAQGYFLGQGGNPNVTDRIDSNGGTVAVVVGHRLFVSTDSGGTFRRVGTKPPVVVAGNTLDSTDGTRVYLVSTAAQIASTYESVDKGLNYVSRYISPPLGTRYQGNQNILVVKVNPGNINNVIAWGNNTFGSTYDGTMLVSQDGLFSAAVSNDQVSGNWLSAFSFAPNAAASSYFYGYYGSQSVNAGLTFSMTYNLTNPDGGQVPFVWYPNAQTMSDPTYGLVFDCTSANRGFRVNNLTHTVADITTLANNALGNDPACSAEVYLAAGSIWRARLISKTGWLATSDDDGLTFTAVSGATGGLTTCNRLITSPTTDRNTVVSWCSGSNSIATSRNAGVTWSLLSAGQNWVKFGCGNITSLVALDTKLLVTCVDRPPVIVDY